MNTNTQLLDGDKTEQPVIHALLVINHKDARIYQTELKGSIPETISPQDNLGHQGHVHSKHDYSDHIEKPNHNEYFGSVTKNLINAEKVLIFGSGEGSSSTMNLYVAWLAEHKNPISDRIVAAVTVDQSHLTEGEILAKAREIYKELLK